MENLSACGLDHRRGHCARRCIHIACLKAIVLRRGEAKCPHAGRSGSAGPGLESATEHYAGGEMRSLPADVCNARSRGLSQTAARSNHARRRRDEVFEMKAVDLPI